MSRSELPCLTLSIDRLTASEKDKPHFAIWVLKAPFPGGYVHHDRIWPDSLTQAWQTWQSMFSLRGLPEVPPVPPDFVPKAIADLESQDFGSFTATSFHLYLSKPGPAASIYTQLADFPLS